MSHTKIYSGSEIMAAAVTARLDDAGIPFIKKDNISSGITAGFGTIGLAVDILVEEADSTAAKEIVAAFERMG